MREQASSSSRAKTGVTMKRRFTVAALAAVFVAILVAAWLYASGPAPLTAQARRIARLYGPDWPLAGISWLSSERRLIVSTDSFNTNTFKWRGHAGLVDVDNGRRTPLPGLTAHLNRVGYMPAEFQISPFRQPLDIGGGRQKQAPARFTGGKTRQGLRHPSGCAVVAGR